MIDQEPARRTRRRRRWSATWRATLLTIWPRSRTGECIRPPEPPDRGDLATRPCSAGRVSSTRA